MFDFHEKRKIRGILYSKPVILFLGVLAAFISLSVYNRYQVAQEMHQKLEERRRVLTELQNRAETLSSKVEYLEGERGIEEELRSRFDVVKEGEQVVIILDSPKQKSEENTENEVNKSASGTSEEHTSWFDFLKFW